VFGSLGRKGCPTSFRRLKLSLITTTLVSKMPVMSKPRRHTMPDNNAQVQREVEERTGMRPCIWQIEVVRMVLEGVDVMTIAATGSGKSLCYWMALLYVKYGIVFLVTPLKLLGKQFVETLEKNKLRAVSMTAANATNELFEVRDPQCRKAIKIHSTCRK
jgi:superfamily II DNA helicase RecQ